MLCCQPEPVPGSLAVRMSLLTQRDPCRLPAWLGRTINMLYRTCRAPVHSITQPRQGTGDWVLPANAQDNARAPASLPLPLSDRTPAGAACGLRPAPDRALPSYIHIHFRPAPARARPAPAPAFAVPSYIHIHFRPGRRKSREELCFFKLEARYRYPRY